MNRDSPSPPAKGNLDLSHLGPGAHLGRQELLFLVASGGMGQVWAARAMGEHGFRRFVAVKTILPSLVNSTELRSRFYDEAKLAARIHHPNVCQIVDLGESGGLPYMVLEWIEGAPLSDLAAPAFPPIDPRAAAKILSQVCAGLHAAHEVVGEDGEPLGVVHRDVSPQNIMVGTGIVKVTDFGIAKAIGRSLVTQAGQVRGKAPYLAPEQLMARPVDRRADVYAAGALLYEACTARRAFDGETDAIILVKVLKDEPISPEVLVPGFPPALAAVISRAMSKRPEDRFPSALAMQGALDDYLAGEPPLADSALARIVEARVGAAIAEKRELVRLAVAALGRKEPGVAAPPALRSGPASSAADPAKVTRLSASSASLPYGETPELVLGAARPPSSDAVETDNAARPDIGFLVAPKARAAAPGFLDPAALAVARGNPPPPAPSIVPAGQERANQIDLMEEALRRQREYLLSLASQTGEKEEAVSPSATRAPVGRWLAAIAVILLVAGAAVLLVPTYAKRRVAAAAEDAGLTLLTSGVTMSASGLVLHDVSVTASALEGVVLKGATVRLSPLLAPTNIDIVGGAVEAKGSFETLHSRAVAWRDSVPGLLQQQVTLDGTALAWRRAFPDDSVVYAEAVHAELEPGISSAALRSQSVRADGPHGTFGPWGFDLATASDGVTMHLLLDPSAPEGATVTLFEPWASDSPTSLSARIARASLAHLGVSPSLLGLEPDDATQLELDMQVAGSVPARLRANVHFILHDARPLGATAATPPLDITFTADANGSASGPVPLHVTELRVGPLAAHASAVMTFDGGLRVDGSWDVKMTCEQLAKAAQQDEFGLGAAGSPLQKLMAGASREGEAEVDGLMTFDTRSLGRIRFSPTYARTCGVPLLTNTPSP